MRLAVALLIAVLAAPVVAGAQSASPAGQDSVAAVPQRDIMDILRGLIGHRVEPDAGSLESEIELTEAAKLIQVGHLIMALIDVQLASEMPLIEKPAASN